MRRLPQRGDAVTPRVVDLEPPPGREDLNARMPDPSTPDVVFRGVRERLVGLIEAHPYVVACVAWVTDPVILRALASRRGVSLVVNAEDFLRPDEGDGGSYRARLRELYDAIPHLYPDTTIPAVRCYGRDPSLEARPRMHHKFAVFLDEDRRRVAAWTGSFNWTKQATRNLENAVHFEEPSAVDAFYDEWALIWMRSKPLDWASDA